jgi:hypothetical protein
VGDKSEGGLAQTIKNLHGTLSRSSVFSSNDFLVSPSYTAAMVGGALARASAFRVGLGVSGATIVSGSCARPSYSRISDLLTSSLSIGISS